MDDNMYSDQISKVLSAAEPGRHSAADQCSWALWGSDKAGDSTENVPAGNLQTCKQETFRHDHVGCSSGETAEGHGATFRRELGKVEWNWIVYRTPRLFQMFRKRYIVCFRIKSVMTFGAVLYILIWLHDIKKQIMSSPFSKSSAVNQSINVYSSTTTQRFSKDEGL